MATVVVTAEKNAQLDDIFSATTYWALSTTTPAADGTNVTEPVGNGYIRATVTAASMAAAAAGAIDNSVVITFPEATGSWGTVTYVLVYDVASGGTPRYAISLTVAKLISSGEIPRFAISAFDLSIT
jgi:hypothetical protein